MKLERTKNTKRNIIIGEAEKLSGIFLPFVVRTLIIHQMGASYLGLTGVFYSVIQMLNLAETGFGMAITYSMYKPIAEDDAKTINALLLFYARVYRFAGAAMGAAGLLLLPLLPHWIKGEVPPGVNIYGLFLIYLFDACLNSFLFPEKKALLAAYQRNDVSSMVHIFTQGGMYVLQIIAICLARDFYLYALTVPLSTAAYSLLCAREAHRLFGQYRNEGALPAKNSREIRRQVAGLLLRRTASLSRNAFDSVFISAHLGLAVAAIYGNYYYVMDAVVMLLAVVKTSMAGGVGNSIAMETKDKNLRDMKTIDFLYMGISGWCAVCLLCLVQPFMELWAGAEMMLPGFFALVFAAYFYLLKMSDIRTLYAESVGLWWQARHLSILEAAVNLFLNWLLIRLMGLPGILYATMVSYFIFNFIGGALVLFGRYFDRAGRTEYFLSHLRYALVTALVGGITYAAAAHIGVSGLSGLLLRGSLCVLLPGILYFLIYRKTGEFGTAKPVLLRLLKFRERGHNI